MNIANKAKIRYPRKKPNTYTVSWWTSLSFSS